MFSLLGSLDAWPSQQWAQCPGSRNALCSFTLRTVFASLMDGVDCEALFALFGVAPYADAPSTGSGTVLWRNEEAQPHRRGRRGVDGRRGQRRRPGHPRGHRHERDDTDTRDYLRFIASLYEEWDRLESQGDDSGLPPAP